jgi:CDP-diacylglycerol--glycerol-3-phosphate 3-phosphatidyltransferase
MVTNVGKLLDPLADKLLISVALIMLVHAHMLSSWVVVVIIGREMLITYIRLLASFKKRPWPPTNTNDFGGGAYDLFGI